MGQESDNREKLKLYKDRVVRWDNRRIDQLSYTNNVILVLSVGFLSFSYDFNSIAAYSITFIHVDWLGTFKVLSLLLMILTIFTGLFLSCIRLADFRLSSKITRQRYRAFKYAGELLDTTDSKPDFSQKEKLCIICKAFESETPILAIDEWKTFKSKNQNEQQKIKSLFKLMRKKSKYIGSLTWFYLKSQIILFFLSILSFSFSIICSA
ncbi:MAG: hypothetical protein WD357_10195 [Gracilimonas sp.]